MKNKFRVLSFILIFAILLTGCGGIDLTEEQSELVSEYATALLLKYDSENHSRLVDTSEFKEKYTTALNEYNKAEKAYYDKKQSEEDKRREEVEKQEASNQTEVKPDKPSNDGTGGATVIDREQKKIEDVYGLKDVSISFVDCETVNVYPKNETNPNNSVISKPGTELLVLYFDVRNLSAAAQKIDCSDVTVSYKISVNKQQYVSAVTSILDDDLSQFVGTIDAGQSKRLVLLAEVKAGLSVSNLTLRVVKGNLTVTEALK